MMRLDMDLFGAAIHLGEDLQFRYGQWATAISEKSLNYRELRSATLRIY